MGLNTLNGDGICQYSRQFDQMPVQSLVCQYSRQKSFSSISWGDGIKFTLTGDGIKYN